jgi:hypothetical protein
LYVWSPLALVDGTAPLSLPVLLPESSLEQERVNVIASTRLAVSRTDLHLFMVFSLLTTFCLLYSPIFGFSRLSINQPLLIDLKYRNILGKNEKKQDFAHIFLKKRSLNKGSFSEKPIFAPKFI